MNLKLTSFFALIVVPLFSASVLAQDPAPRDVRDLIGSRASSGDSALRSRGYEFYNSSRSGSRIYSNWWKQRSRTCLSVVTYDGRFDSIVTAPSFDCGLADDGSEHESDKVGSTYGDKWYDEYIGGRARSAETEFERRGYRNVDGMKEGYRSITWWHQRENDRCFKVTVASGNVENIRADRGGCDGRRSHDTSSHDYESSHGRGATLYVDTRYRGTSEEVEGEIASMKRTRIGNDELSSVRVSRGCTVELFEDDDFRGRSIVLRDDEPDLGDTRMGNDEVSSVIVDCR